MVQGFSISRMMVRLSFKQTCKISDTQQSAQLQWDNEPSLFVHKLWTMQPLALTGAVNLRSVILHAFSTKCIHLESVTLTLANYPGSSLNFRRGAPQALQTAARSLVANRRRQLRT